MLHPLVSLWRHACRVTFYQSVSPADAALFDSAGRDSPSGARRFFRSSDEAYNFLRYWMGDPSATSELRWLLQRSGPSLSGGQGGREALMQALAGRLASGAVVVMEESPRRGRPGRLVAAPGSAAGAGAQATLAALPKLNAIPRPPVALNLLPALEDIRVEGAEVLPELNQSLEQVKASIGSVGAVSGSLEPAPSKVADIQTALREAAARSSAGLSEL